MNRFQALVEIVRLVPERQRFPAALLAIVMLAVICVAVAAIAVLGASMATKVIAPTL